MHDAAGVYVGGASAQCLDLGLAKRDTERLHLPVDVRLGNMVEVDQHHGGDSAARQRFRRP